MRYHSLAWEHYCNKIRKISARYIQLEGRDQRFVADRRDVDGFFKKRLIWALSEGIWQPAMVQTY